MFNLCVEVLLQGVQKENKRRGALIKIGEEGIEFAIQADENDVMSVSPNPEGIGNMLRALEDFTRCSKMEIYVGKCATTSYMTNSNHHGSTLAHDLSFEGQGIPNLIMAQSLKYMGKTISRRCTIKVRAAETKLTRMKIRMQKIVEFPLKIVQKIDAIKTFVLLAIDSTLLNGYVGRGQLTKMDKKSRAEIDELLNIRGFRVECHHAPWREGSLSYSNLIDHRQY
jgi:hypothetical protein